MTSEKEPWWKAAAVIITALAVLITAIATLLPVIMDDDGEEPRDVEFRREEHLVEEPIEPVNHRDADLGDDFGLEEHPIEEPSDDIRRAEELAVVWVDSLKHKDIESVVTMADTPFYSNQGLLMRIEDVEEMYRVRFSQEHREDEAPGLSVLQAKTISEIEREEYPDDYEWVYSSLHLTDNDIAVLIIWDGGGGLMLAFRRVDSDMRMVGLWWDLL